MIGVIKGDTRSLDNGSHCFKRLCEAKSTGNQSVGELRSRRDQELHQ